MASSSSSRLCSDEELQKAKVDLDEFLADEDEFDCLSGDEDEGGNKEEKETLGKKKKKVVAPMETVQTFLNFNYKCSIPVREHKSEDFGEIGTLPRVGDVFIRHFVDRITALQDKLRHEVEATDDEDEEEQEQEEKHEDTLPASGTNAA